MDEPPDRIEIHGDFVVLTHAGIMGVFAPVASIRLIGEFTTAEGPWFPDWFFVLIVDEDHGVKLSIGTIGLEKAMSELSARLNARVQMELLRSTEFRSRIIWPQEYAEEPLFSLMEKDPHRGGWPKLRDRIIGSRHDVVLSSHARAALRPANGF
jgi:hypothetical protein